MQTEEIIKITRDRVAELVKIRERSEDARLFEGDESRKHPRWPFPAAVELAPADGDGRTRWFATCGNLSIGGLGLIADHYFPPGMVVDLSCHLPEATLYGQGTVRHCRQTAHGYLVGVEFNFPQ
jgi:hypothetical protein